MARAIAILGASNTGKSTLVDRMCALEGQPQQPAGAGELRIAEFTHLDETWQAIDTPGSIELLHVACDALLAADAAVICVGPDPSAAVLASPYLHAVEAAGTPAVLFINRIDEATAPVRDIVAALQDYALHPIVLRQIPIREGGQITGSVDLVSERAWHYREGEPSQLVEIPAGMVEREHAARDDMLEQLSEHDDTLLEELIEDRTPASSEVYAICARVLRENRVLEALIGSAAHGNGIVRVMKALRHEAPGPAALRERLQDQAGLERAAGRRDLRQHLPQARRQDPAAARAAAARLRPAARRPATGQMSPADPRDSRHLDEIPEGVIASAVKADHLAAGKLATADALYDPPAWHQPQPAIMHRVLAPTAERDSVKLSGSLASLAEGDSALTVSQDPATGGALVGVQGPLHLRLLRQHLKEVFGMEVEEVAPSAAYCETISKPQDTAYRHKKQTGGAGQFADVKLTVSPGARGSGFIFAEVVKGGAVPRNYIPAVETGARDAMERGPLGFPVLDVTRDPHRRAAPPGRQLGDGLPHRRPPRRRRGAEGRRPGAAAAGLSHRHPRPGALHRRPRPDRRLASRPGARLRRRSGSQGLGDFPVPGARQRAGRPRQRHPRRHPGRRLVRGGLRPLRGAARQGRRPHRPGPRTRTRLSSRPAGQGVRTTVTFAGRCPRGRAG